MPSTPNFKLRLYIRGSTLAGSRSLTNLEQFCAEHLPGRHSLEVIDLDRDPSRAHTDDIIAIPTLIRLAPGPTRRIVGEIVNPARLMVALGLESASTTAPA